MQQIFKFLTKRLFTLIILFSASSLFAQMEDNIKVGVLLPLSGNLSPYGQELLQGIQLALDNLKSEDPKLNARLSVIVKNDAGIPKTSESMAEELYQKEKVHAIIGSVATFLTFQIAKIAQKYEKPLIVPIATEGLPEKKQNPYIFQTSIPDPKQGSVMGIFAQKHLRRKKAAILYQEESLYSKSAAEEFKRTFTAKGGEVKIMQGFKYGTTEFRPILETVMTNAPDVVLLPVFIQDVKNILEQAKALSVKIPFIGTDSWDNSFYHIKNSSLFEGNYFVTHFSPQDPHPAVKRFVDQYLKKFNKVPGSLAALGYDAASFTINAAGKINVGRNQSLQQILSQKTEYETLSGKMSLNDDHKAVKALPVLVITSTDVRFMTKIIPE
ncbi:MAG: ABC transporter substrate-binding protein [Oligoflexales bacterium]|nr:ABC transporter substrate-binding protein [Oligoflexales bacterium]